MKGVLATGHAPTQPSKHPKWTFEVSDNMMEWLLENESPPVRLSARKWTDGRVLLYLEYVPQTFSEVERERDERS